MSAKNLCSNFAAEIKSGWPPALIQLRIENGELTIRRESSLLTAHCSKLKAKTNTKRLNSKRLND